jgi:LysR family transcriptional regulator, hydrogen peroxide-inducible genes activator
MFDVNIRDLKYLVKVADLGHFGKAAKACFVSQPALSMQIKKLELDLGVELFERTNKSVLLTDTGTSIVALARQILQQVDNLHEVANAAKDPLSGEIRLGVFPTLGPYLLPYIMPSLAKSLPTVLFHLVEEKTEVLIEKLNNGSLHAAILSIPVPDKGLIMSSLFEEEFVLAKPKDSHLSQQKSITKDEIDNKKLLLLDDGHCMKNEVVSFCSNVDKENSQTFRATSLEVLRHMVASGAGITLMPKLSTKNCELLTYIPFCTPKPVRTIGLVYKECSAKKLLLNEIEKLIRTIMSTVNLIKISNASATT